MGLVAKTKTVTFRDGTTLIVSEENWTVAGKIRRLEEEAEKLPPLDDPDAQSFRLYVYPKLLAAVVGGDMPPDEATALAMPTDELDKWFEPVRELNPKWYTSTSAAPSDADEETKEKKRKRSRLK